MTDEHIRISWDVDNARDIIHLPEVAYSYLDAQPGAVDIGLDREWMRTLHMMLSEWIRVTSYVSEAASLSTTNNECSHEEAWFDRTICPKPCGSMHTYCCACAERMDGCLTEDLAISLQELRDGKGVPAKTWGEEFLYDGQDMNSLCICGHAAMVHTSGTGNCLAFGESDQRSSHCLEFTPPQTDDVSDDCCSDTCACEDVPMDPVTVCTECDHPFDPHQKGDGGCPSCDCRVGERVIPPVLHLCDRCHGEVYTFPEEIIGLAQRMEGTDDRWASFTYTDGDGDELLISDGVHKDDRKIGVNISTPVDGVFIPLGVLEAVISAIRESGHRAIISENE